MRTCNSTLRYYDWFGKVHIAQGKTGGQQGDPIEMLIFNLSIHHLWGRTLMQHPRARAVAYADDGYIKAPLSVALHVLAALKDTFHDDAALDFNMFKTNILVKGISAQAAHAAAHRHIATHPALNTFSNSLALNVFTDEGLVGLGVPLGTDDFVQNFVRDKCKDILEDVNKLGVLTDGFIHYQLLRFCQATRLQYINSHVLLHNQNILQQQR